jgi:hypothetical protein
VTREVSLEALAGMFAQETDEVPLVFLTFSGGGLGAPIRIVDDAVSHVRGGQTFQPFPFEVKLPDDVDDQLPRTQVRCDNVDRSITDAIRALAGDELPDCELVVALASDPDTLEAGPFVMSVKGVSFDALVLEAEIGYGDMLEEPFGKYRFTPNNSPGLF